MDDWFISGLRDANHALRAAYPDPTLEQKRRMWRNIARSMGRGYFAWGFVAGTLAGVGGVLLVR